MSIDVMTRALVILLGFLPPAQAAEAYVPSGPPTRGRVWLSPHTIVTDWGTQLRGECWGLDINNRLFTREELFAMKMCGLNTIHVYAEVTNADEPKPVGYSAERMDSIVSWCRQESLYVIMTMGGPIMRASLDRLRAIWRFYAPRYADETHVVYEPKNEGCYATYHCDEQVMQAIKDCYAIIRENAPATHVLLLSHSNLKGGIDALFEDVERLGPEIDWGNASIAFHGYGTTGGFQEEAAKALNDAGYGMTCTEFPTGNGLEASYERAGISYMNFFVCHSLANTCSYVKKLSATWQPDFGAYPQPHVEHTVQTIWRSWTARREPFEGPTCRVLIDGRPLRDVCSVYDLTGKLIWRSRPQAGAPNAVEVGTPGLLGSRVLVVK